MPPRIPVLKEFHHIFKSLIYSSPEAQAHQKGDWKALDQASRNDGKIRKVIWRKCKLLNDVYEKTTEQFLVELDAFSKV